MSENALAPVSANIVENVVLGGDLSKLQPAERVAYYRAVCDSLGLNPLTQPFAYIRLNGKLTLYAKRDAADQLRRIHGISIDKPDVTFQDDMVIVSVTGRDRAGRTDSDLGVVPIGNKHGDQKANAILKAITKAKRRLTLSIVGLGWLDETEVETIPNAQPVPQPIAESQPDPLPHWIDRVDKEGRPIRNRFWAWTSEQGLSNAEVYAALEVEHIHDYDGSMGDAMEKIEKWISARLTTAEAEADGNGEELPF